MCKLIDSLSHKVCDFISPLGWPCGQNMVFSIPEEGT